jgi:enolase
MLVQLTNVRTVSDLVNTCKEAQQDRLGVVLSTSDIETGDSALADLAVALQVGMMKVGPMQRAENMSKYNTLARLEAQLGKEAFYAAERFREPV